MTSRIFTFSYTERGPDASVRYFREPVRVEVTGEVVAGYWNEPRQEVYLLVYVFGDKTLQPVPASAEITRPPPAESSVERATSEDNNDEIADGFHWFHAERSSHAVVVQKVRDQWYSHVSGPLTMAQLERDGWEYLGPVTHRPYSKYLDDK